MDEAVKNEYLSPGDFDILSLHYLPIDVYQHENDNIYSPEMEENIVSVDKRI